MHLHAIALMFVVLPLGSCWTSLSVKSVDSSNRTSVKGIRYSLPIPVLRVTPKPDGTVEVDVEYIPDDSRTYAIHSSSLLAMHDLEVGVKNDFLTSVEWNADSAAVASELVSSASDIGKSVIDNRASTEEAARKEAEAAQKERSDEIESARSAVQAAITQEEIAKVRLNILKSSASATPAQVLTAELDLATAERNRIAAEQRLAALLQANQVGLADAQNAMQDASTRVVHGPVFFRIQNMPNDDVRLVAISREDSSKQPTYESATVAAAKPKPALPQLSSVSGAYAVLPLRGPLSDAQRWRDRATAVHAALTRAGSGATPEAISAALRDLAESEQSVIEAQKLVFVIASDQPIATAGKATLEGKLEGEGATVPNFELAQESPLRFRLALREPVPNGTYLLTFEHGTPAPSISFDVRR